MSITLTPTAATYLLKMLQEVPGAKVVRLGLKPAGCSGVKYKLEAVTDIFDTDLEFNSQGLKIVVDEKKLVFVEGTEIDYVKEGLNSKFVFNNPNVEEACGCGESVTFKKEEE